ncbi:hypothetical protein ACTXT7_004489 [Hymenolepis weldensis]
MPEGLINRLCISTETHGRHVLVINLLLRCPLIAFVPYLSLTHSNPYCDLINTFWPKTALGFWGAILAFIGVFLTDGKTVMRDGFFRGYSFLVVFVIILQSVGGLLIAVVIKYADNILKVFSTSISIILSCLASYYVLDDFEPNWYFAIGTLAVIGATVLYSLGGQKTPQQPELPVTVVKS